VNISKTKYCGAPVVPALFRSPSMVRCGGGVGGWTVMLYVTGDAG